MDENNCSADTSETTRKRPSRPELEYVFAYGTLRNPGSETYELDGYRLETAAASGHRYPVIRKDPDYRVVGNLVGYTKQVLEDIVDRYEGVPYLYRRERVSVKCGDAAVKAWIYVPTAKSLLSDDNIVIGTGDWLNPDEPAKYVIQAIM